MTVIIPPPPGARARFVALGLEQLGKPVLWGQRGPDVFDCSGLVTWLLKQVGGPDLTHIENAQALFEHSRSFVDGEAPLPGDLAFYGIATTRIVHVAIWLAGGKVLSADGATSRITALEHALAAGAKVRLHDTVDFRHDTPVRVVHRFTALDALDRVSR